MKAILRWVATGIIGICAVILVICVVIWSLFYEPPGDEYVFQKIPIEIQSGKPLAIEIRSFMGSGRHEVAVRCLPALWNELTNGPTIPIIRLKSSNKPDTQIGGVSPGALSGGPAHYITNAHFLFYIDAQYEATASLEITFPNAPPGITRTEIIVCKTPAETGL